jgi:hypothetical protein
VLKRRGRWWLAGVALAVVFAAGSWWWFQADPGDVRLRAYVHARPPVPVVFTSRTEPASFRAAAPQGEGFVYPGQRLWQAREGRLRLLTPAGTVHELTWGKPLPDGGTLIDVMSPSVSADGRTIVFAGRRADGHGHFRLYEVGVEGRGLRQLTGGPDDPGCTALPPLRYAADGRTILPDDERRRTDYDDVDPVYVDYSSRLIAFASSRTPDLGRGHARRSTTLWLLHLDGGHKYPLTANRHNDRWPFALASNYLTFSLWSRNQEVITADERDIRPWEPGMSSATAPTDAWLGALIQPGGGQFGALVKPHLPVWRPRPLFNGRIVFMTAPAYPSFDHDAAQLPALQAVQVEPGVVGSVPSARPAGSALPAQQDYRLLLGPRTDAAGRPLCLATPSPCPPHHVLLAAAPLEPGAAGPRPAAYGIYLAGDDWEPSGTGAVTAEAIGLTALFDDPDLVDAEPVAVYTRHSQLWPRQPPAPPAAGPADEVRLADGTTYRGPVGTVFNSSLYVSQLGDLPGQRTDRGEGPIFDRPPPGSLHTIKIFAARRDRFDDPVRPRLAGTWELLAEMPVTGDSFGGRLPAGVPTVLAGFGADGRVVRWTTAARDAQGRQATFYAFAGDHYSAVRSAGKHFCLGCHPGHSGLARADHRHAERLP